jgi:hypothetical protein
MRAMRFPLFSMPQPYLSAAMGIKLEEKTVWAAHGIALLRAEVLEEWINPACVNCLH